MEMEANSSPSSFFKVILAQSLQKGGSLQFPKSFVDRHGSCFPKYACLEVPTGATWKVELRKSEGRVWLQYGWPEFAEFYSIDEGYFLVFKHEGGSFFHVLIFNATGMEIKYPVGSTFTTPRVDSKVTEIKDEDTDATSDHDHDHASPRKLQKTRRAPLVDRSGKRQVEKSGSKQIVSLSASMKNQLNHTHYRFKRRMLEKAGIFKSEKPHFILYMTPNLIAHRGVMRIPAAHFKRYLRKDYDQHGRNDMLLHGSKGRSWGVQFTANRRNPNDAAFSYGWKQFVVENKLEAGDVCVFEMMKGKAREYKLIVYHLRT